MRPHRVGALTAAAVLAAFLLLRGGPTAADGPLCGAYPDLARRLAERYGERPVARGLAVGGALVEVFATPGGATWTLLLIAPDGRACAVVAGENWRPLARPVGPPA